MDAAIRALFSPEPGTTYLDSAPSALPPEPSLRVMGAALDDWKAGRANWIEDWDMAGERGRAAFAALVGIDPGRVALLPATSVGVGLVAAELTPPRDAVRAPPAPPPRRGEVRRLARLAARARRGRIARAPRRLAGGGRPRGARSPGPPARRGPGPRVGRQHPRVSPGRRRRLCPSGPRRRPDPGRLPGHRHPPGAPRLQRRRRHRPGGRGAEVTSNRS